jgi:Fic family protein
MILSKYHAGHYEAQYEYQSFLPSMVNHPWIIDDPALLELQSQADRALGELNAFSQLVPNVDFFIQMYVAREATYSSRIEGTQTNVEDAFKQADDVAPERRDDWSEVQNYIQALNYAVERLDTLPLSNRLLKETHAILLQGVRGESKQPGEFRSSQNWIGVSLKHAVFIPPHHEQVDELMADLEKFLHDDSHHVSLLIKIAVAHYQFETIHPFLDGNGRLGRLLIPLFLASERILVKPALYLSDYFERNKTVYVDHLMAVRQGHHMREWLMFFLYGVVETARSSVAVFKGILALKERIDRDVLPRFSTRRQDNAQQLMRRLYKKPVIDVKAVSELLGTTPHTSGGFVRDLVEFGVLVEITGQRRNRLFVFREYLALFSRGNPE